MVSDRLVLGFWVAVVGGEEWVWYMFPEDSEGINKEGQVFVCYGDGDI